MIDSMEQSITGDTEQSLINTARNALSQCNWVVGECAAQWTQKYARGRTDADFGQQIGLSQDQVYQRRRVWDSFHDVREEYANLKWSHFYVALNWEDASECLSWAEENQATVAEMRAWRRSIHGEDLSTTSEEDALQLLDYDPVSVREPAVGATGAGEQSVPFEVNVAGGEVRDEVPYSPFRKDARGEAVPGEAGSFETEASSTAKPQESPQKIARRVVNALRRARQQLSEIDQDTYNQLAPELLNSLADAYDDLEDYIKR